MVSQSFLLSAVQSFDLTNTNHAYLREYVVQKRLQIRQSSHRYCYCYKFDQSVFAIKMVMIQASEPPLHIGFKVRRQTFSQGVR
jgi:hypothetical protein